MKKDESRGGSRAELIQMARENCSMQMSSFGVARGYDNPQRIYQGRERHRTQAGNEGTQSVFNFTILRVFCAVVLFAIVILADQFGFEYKDIKSSDVAEYISSNEVMDGAEEFFSSLTKEKIVSVFNGRK